MPLSSLARAEVAVAAATEKADRKDEPAAEPVNIHHSREDDEAESSSPPEANSEYGQRTRSSSPISKYETAEAAKATEAAAVAAAAAAAPPPLPKAKDKPIKFKDVIVRISNFPFDVRKTRSVNYSKIGENAHQSHI